MDRHVRRLLNRVAIALAAVATAALLHLFRSPPTSCGSLAQSFLSLSMAPLPRTSCDATSRRVVDPDLRSSPCWKRHAAALYASCIDPLRRLRLLGGSSRVLCLAASAGQAVDALRVAGVEDVTGVDLVDFPPLVRRADPHNLPFFDDAFDLVLSNDPAAFTGALFPSRFAFEIERTVRRGGAIAITVDRHVDHNAVVRLFGKSRLVDVRNATLDGSAASVVILSARAINSICFFWIISRFDIKEHIGLLGELLVEMLE